MKNLLTTAGIAAILALGATATFAQTTVFTGSDIVEDRNDDLADAIEDDAERDLDRFGNEGRPQGFDGSFALRAVGSEGNTESFDVGLGANLGYVAGPNGFDFSLSYIYGEDDGTKTEESLFYDAQYTRDFNPRFYGFAKIVGSIDEFSAFDNDTFAGFGVGYRIINDSDIQWSVQAGPGYRFASIDSALEGDIDEVALAVSSDYSNRLGQMAVLTNDTDIITSETDTVVLNDLAVSYSLSGNLALRTSLLTEYHTDPQPTFEHTDNTLGVSLVYNF